MRVPLTTGQIWLPALTLSDAAPRQIQLFTDATGAPWVRWWCPGFPSTGGAVSARSFRQWARRTCAALVAVDVGGWRLVPREPTREMWAAGGNAEATARWPYAGGSEEQEKFA